MYAINGPDWVELQLGHDVVIGGVVSSYQTVAIWSDATRAAKGIKTIVNDAVPDGKVATGSSLVDDDGTPRRVWTLMDVPPPAVPDAVTPLQMRKALRAAGLRPQVDTYLATLSEEAQEAWEYCVEVRRDDPFIADAADALGMTAEQRDDLFRLAASL